MKSTYSLLLAFTILLISGACQVNDNHVDHLQGDWKTTLDKKLPLLGHRNWILVVDKAFPLQTGDGIEVVYTGEKLIPVLSHVLSEIEESNHVMPQVYTDKELNYLNDSLVEGISEYKS